MQGKRSQEQRQGKGISLWQTPRSNAKLHNTIIPQLANEMQPLVGKWTKKNPGTMAGTIATLLQGAELSDSGIIQIRQINILCLWHSSGIA